MRLIKREIDRVDGPGSVALMPEEPEDMWHLYNLIRIGDRLRATALRKIQLNTSDTGSSKSERVRTTLTIVVNKLDFDPQAGQLHISGRVCEENQYVEVGQYHTLDLELNRKLTLFKDEWDTVAVRTIQEATEVGEKSEVAAVVCQEGIANLCFITDHMTVVKQRIDVAVPKKRREGVDGHEKGVQKFYAQVYTAMLRLFDFSKLKVILLASPGFIADGLKKYIFNTATTQGHTLTLQSKPKFVVVHCSSGHVHSLNEVLQSPEVKAKLSDTRFARESAAMDRFLQMMTTDENRAWYGMKEVAKAVDQGAVGTLLVSNRVFRNDNVRDRKRWVKIVEEVQKQGGETMVLSSIHESGVRLDGLGGVAAILTYPLYDLDEAEEEIEENANRLERPGEKVDVEEEDG
ncbi:hypothetical protein EX30DRAFT_338501 [Ascodesmis nigricans]|uniref:Protein DOM34 homolog n=1 Tax=Ascodesmis nigricans TaxID=341454 RepID=A0A4S2N4A4_9PEZI|nr:hypothetical protein EX30DRAFT_338501 [Ascodesmis nigricans]